MSKPARTTIFSFRRSSPNLGTLGVLGYRYLEENADKVQPVQIAGVSPSEATIADLSYPGARKLYIYVKGEHLRGEAVAQGFRRGLLEAVGQGRRARKARSGALRRRGLGSCCEAGNRAQAARSLDAEVSANRHST